MKFKSPLKFSFYSSILTLLIFTVVLAAFLWRVNEDFTIIEQMDNGPGELIINDELSLWHSPFTSNITYSAYEPVRVRESSTKYTHRFNKDMAASGLRFGEIEFLNEAGKLIYLPRDIEFNREDKLSLFIRSEKNSNDWQIMIYQSADKMATVSSNSKLIEEEQYGDWKKIKIPFSKISFRNLPQNDLKTDTREPDFLLSRYEPSKKNIHSIVFGLNNAKKGDKLYIDRLAIEKNYKTPKQTIYGVVILPSKWNIFADSFKNNLTIKAITRDGVMKAKIDSKGHFKITLPKESKILQIYAESNDIAYSPLSGRFMEIGDFIPPITIDVRNKNVKNPVKDGNVNDSLLVYDAHLGPRFEPNQNFLVQREYKGQVVMSSELKTNNFGFIDSTRHSKNLDNTYRVLVLGECHHMGVHIAQADMWNNQTEAMLNILTDQPVEVISGSFNYSSYTSSWPIFRDYGDIVKPDLVLIPIIDPGLLNLSVEEYMMDWLGAGKDHRVSYQFELDKNGVLIHKPNDPDWELYREPFPKEDHERVRAQYLSSSYVFADKQKEPQWVKDNIKLSIESFKEFSLLAKKRKQRIGILYISDYGASRIEEFTEKVSEKIERYDPNLFRPLIREIAEASGLEFFDISNEFHMAMNGKDKKYIFNNSDGHLTAYGHFRYGQALARQIKQIIDE